jgi:hypothetical protein
LAISSPTSAFSCASSRRYCHLSIDGLPDRLPDASIGQRCQTGAVTGIEDEQLDAAAFEGGDRDVRVEGNVGTGGERDDDYARPSQGNVNRSSPVDHRMAT